MKRAFYLHCHSRTNKSVLIILLYCFLISLLVSCNAYFENKQKESQRKDDSTKLSELPFGILDTSTPSVSGQATKKDIGDIESDLHITVTVPKDELPESATVQEETSGAKLLRSEIIIPPPYPDKLAVRIQVQPEGKIDYSKYPIGVEGKIIRDEEVIDSFKTAITTTPKPGEILSVDEVLPTTFHIVLWDTPPTSPNSTLIFVRATISLYPQGTTASTIMNTHDTTPLETTEILSNPLRITLK